MLVANKPSSRNLAFNAVLPPNLWINKLVAVLSLTRIISVVTSLKLKRLPIGWLPIQPEPPPTTTLLRLSFSFNFALP